MSTPNPRVMYFLIAMTLIVTGIISYNTYQNKKPTQPVVAEPETNLAVVVENQYKSSDTDGDGLFDWEETLWKTNPDVADSDKDGTDDGEEVALSRDPNKAGPDDIRNPNDYLESFVTNAKVSENSLTSQIARNLLIAVGQTDGQTNVANELLLQIESAIKKTNPLKKENLTTFTGDTEKMQDYANNFLKIYSEEMLVVSVALPNDNKTIVDSYNKMATRLSALAVPADIAQAHASFINNLINMGIFTEIVINGEVDPIKMVAVIPKFAELADEQGVLVGQIKSYLESNGIIFESNE